MKIILCLAYSSFTKQTLTTVKSFIAALKSYEITALHVIDKQLFLATTGYETQLNDDLQRESHDLKELCIEYLGENITYVEEYGILNLEIHNAMAKNDHDLVLLGNHGGHGLAERLLGSTAEYIIRNSKKPVLLIP